MVLLCDFNDNNVDSLLGETIGYAVLDSGCTRTVCGDIWLNTYLDTLSIEERKAVKSTKSDIKFRFGDGHVYTSARAVHLPVHLGSTAATLTTQVIDLDIPLLLSRESMKKAGAQLDFTSDIIAMFDEEIPLFVSQSGHYCVSLTRTLDRPNSPGTRHVLFSTPILPDDEHCERKVTKLHKQFAHPVVDKLKGLLRNAGITDKTILNTVDKVTSNCDVCKRFRKPPLRPTVALPVATQFNETVAMDLKVIGGVNILHMIDHTTRYSAACVIPNKKKETIVQGVLEYWVRIFGSPKYFLTDNGGEFVNDEMIEYAEKFNIVLKTTAAESPWSNGLCEKHNETLANHIIKTMDDANCSIKLAVHWAVAAKNSLSNVYGFSPNQLVFGRNPNFPSTYHNKLPAQDSVCHSEYITANLVALHKAREVFIRQESCEKLRRALSKQTRTYSDIVFSIGDYVYYKRNRNVEWHGPARVLGRDGQQYLLKHGGVYVRVHPCRMQPCETGEEVTISADHISDNSPSLPMTVSPIPNDVSSDEEHSSGRNSPLTPPCTPAQYQHDIEPGVDMLVNPDIIDMPAGPASPDLPQHQSPERQSQPETVAPRVRIPRALARLQDHNNPGNLERDSSEEEVFFGNSVDSARFDQPKMEELQKWRDMETYVEVEDVGQPRISSRWVCTEKVKGGKLVCKARLVARGFDEDTDQLKKDSPTCQKVSLRCLLAILSSKGWDLCSIDIKSAYLQGIPINRELYMIPPEIAKTDKLWALRKCPYGLADAGRHWYLRIVQELKSLSGKQLQLDQAVFVWHDNDGNLDGLMVIHVDDFLYGGNNTFGQSVIAEFRKIFTIGTEESRGMKYLGLHIQQSLNSTISFSTNIYSNNLSEIDTTNIGVDKSKPLSPIEVSQLRQLSGQLNWVATQSRPDCGFDNCCIANSVKNATAQDIITANKAIRRVRGQQVTLTYPNTFDLSSCRIVGFTDSSFANLPDRGSQGGYLIFICDMNGVYSLIAWQSRRIKRVVKSSKAAECLAAVEATEACLALNALLSDMLYSSEPMIPISILSDNKSLVDHVHSSTPVADKRLQIDIGVLRDTYQRKEIQEFRWIPTELQAANALTKTGCSTQYLLDIIRLQRRFDFHTGAFV